MKWLNDLIAKLAAKKVAKILKLEDGPMEDGKKWYKSKTIWSDIVTGLLGVYGILTPILATHGINLPEIPPVLFTLLGALGIYGRSSASGPITK